MRNIQLLLVVLVLALSACDWIWDNPEPEEEKKLTEATQDGENTISCLVNGEVWLPWSGEFLSNGISCQHYLYTEGLSQSLWGQLNFVCERYGGSEGESRVIINCVNVNDVGMYALYYDSIGVKAEGAYRISSGSGDSYTTKKYVTHKSSNNWLKLTLRDTINRIVSGRFQFDAINEENDTDTVKVREGRFDLRF